MDRKIIKILAELEEALVRNGLSESDASELVDVIEEQISDVLDGDDENEVAPEGA
ncbi:MAG: hypothetical protein A4E32_00492 [Methanomassiliicoccales archaeon PtaU1.Bin124]|nr:MAG: hypothetical protein A4E32_00492 [Methanomassiliicoccales archaeon PtaU1.Bin124]